MHRPRYLLPHAASLAITAFGLPLAGTGAKLAITAVAATAFTLAAHAQEDGGEAGAPKEMLDAVNAYLKTQDSPMAGKVTVTLDSNEGDTYRILVIPNDPQEADLADGYLRKKGNAFEVLGLGTDFDAQFYADKKIPEGLQDPVTPDVFKPVKAETLGKVREELQKALGKELKATESVPFTDYYSSNQDSGRAALLLLTGSEADLGAAKALHEKTTQVFSGQGWKEDATYKQESPSGITSMYRGPGSAFAFLSAVWTPSPDSGLTEEDDATLADLKPEQKLYRVEWFMGEPVPGATLSQPEGGLQLAPATSLPPVDLPPVDAALPGE